MLPSSGLTNLFDLILLIPVIRIHAWIICLKIAERLGEILKKLLIFSKFLDNFLLQVCCTNDSGLSLRRDLNSEHILPGEHFTEDRSATLKLATHIWSSIITLSLKYFSCFPSQLKFVWIKVCYQLIVSFWKVYNFISVLKWWTSN